MGMLSQYADSGWKPSLANQGNGYLNSSFSDSANDGKMPPKAPYRTRHGQMQVFSGQAELPASLICLASLNANFPV